MSKNVSKEEEQMADTHERCRHWPVWRCQGKLWGRHPHREDGQRQKQHLQVSGGGGDTQTPVCAAA